MINKIIVIIVILLALGWGASLVIREARRVGVNQGYEPDQPIAYSHKVHAGDNQIPCLYCHFAAEKGRHAGIPAVSICMNCHRKIKTGSPEIKKIREALEKNEPIQWVKVHRLPDFAYFNHSQHVNSGKVICQDCHGAVQTMTRVRQENDLTMGWCINCHREKGVIPPEGHLEDRHRSIGGEDCSKCHY